MNCEKLISNLGFDCQPLANGALRLWSPFTYGDDGEIVGLYIEPTSGGLRVTDHADSLFHASAMGAKLTKARIETLRRIAGPAVTVSDGGEIFATADANSVAEAVVSVLNTALGVSHFEALWKPRTASTEFSERVGEVLDEYAGTRVKRNRIMTGASGHQIEIPFVIENGTERTFIQPVAHGEERLEWDGVYRGLGKMLDLKNAGADDKSRIIVIEDVLGDEEVGKAATLLSVCATVVYFSHMRQWATQRIGV